MKRHVEAQAEQMRRQAMIERGQRLSFERLQFYRRKAWRLCMQRRWGEYDGLRGWGPTKRFQESRWREVVQRLPDDIRPSEAKEYITTLRESLTNEQRSRRIRLAPPE